MYACSPACTRGRARPLLSLTRPRPVAPGVQDWQAIEAPDGVTHYVNKKLRYDVTVNPVEPRFKTLVQIIKESKVEALPLDEVRAASSTQETNPLAQGPFRAWKIND